MVMLRRSEFVETLRVNIERLCQLATAQQLDEIPAARLDVERALGDLTNAAAPAPAARPVVEKSVLIVEDNPDVAETLRVILEMSGHRARTAGTGRQAIEETCADPPDVALVDIGLPDIDGCEVGRAVRSQPRGQAVYLVALTGYGAPFDRDRVLRAGFDVYLVKPVDPNKLLDVIAQGHR
jgi:CheY-like chemotaxis protein